LSVDSPARKESILRFDVTEADDDNSELPERLSVIEPLDVRAAVRTRVFHLRGRPAVALPPVNWVINGHKFNPDRVEATPRLGEVEIWRFINHHAFFGHLGMLHPVHVHLSPFQVLRRNGHPPEVFEGGWKDTVSVEPGETVDVLVRFDHYQGRYLVHCHNLEHEDHAMMARFDVI
jgi:FtsP/CotA-like multicopper oxidase with cupredoxin domain